MQSRKRVPYLTIYLTLVTAAYFSVNANGYTFDAKDVWIKYAFFAALITPSILQYALQDVTWVNGRTKTFFNYMTSGMFALFGTTSVRVFLNAITHKLWSKGMFNDVIARTGDWWVVRRIFTWQQLCDAIEDESAGFKDWFRANPAIKEAVLKRDIMEVNHLVAKYVPQEKIAQHVASPGWSWACKYNGQVWFTVQPYHLAVAAGCVALFLLGAYCASSNNTAALRNELKADQQVFLSSLRNELKADQQVFNAPLRGEVVLGQYGAIASLQRELREIKVQQLSFNNSVSGELLALMGWRAEMDLYDLPTTVSDLGKAVVQSFEQLGAEQSKALPESIKTPTAVNPPSWRTATPGYRLSSSSSSSGE